MKMFYLGSSMKTIYFIGGTTIATPLLYHYFGIHGYYHFSTLGTEALFVGIWKTAKISASYTGLDKWSTCLTLEDPLILLLAEKISFK